MTWPETIGNEVDHYGVVLGVLKSGRWLGAVVRHVRPEKSVRPRHVGQRGGYAVFEVGGAQHDIEALIYYSDDEGKTWHRNANGQMLVTLDYSGQGHWTCSEPVAVEYAPNHLLMLYRTELGCLFQSWSSDDGTNWTQPRPTRLSADQSPAALKRIPGTNDLLVVWNQSKPHPVR